MDSRFAVIPAAIGMMLGPQVISSIFFATSKKSRPTPGIREWMNKNSWPISIIVCVFFIYAMLS
jgi:small neutral amino acid transporter SnatA (MarC family)